MASDQNLEAKTILVTGGAGFIGSAVVRYLLKETKHRVVNIDKLTYSGSLLNIDGHIPATLSPDRYRFFKADICDTRNIESLYSEFKPEYTIHLAAESHVDRSISGPEIFIESNIKGTFSMLEAARSYFNKLSDSQRQRFRFLHVSTDEVFGSLGETGYFSETTAYAPNSPYSASKAASDHLVRAWHHTFGLPVLITNCSNNYGPFQFPEKLIPVAITKALNKEPIPVYGKGLNVRDWLYVDDHARALMQVIERGSLGETYNVGCKNERTNIEVVTAICKILDELRPVEGFTHTNLISYVTDRAGHDLRYAIDPTKIEKSVGWKPLRNFEEGLKETVQWYLQNQSWITAIVAESKSKK